MNGTGRGKKLSLMLTDWLPRVHFFVHEIFLCYPKKFRALIGRNLISVNDASLVKYRVYDATFRLYTSPLHTFTHILCVFGLGTRKKRYVKKKKENVCYYFTWFNFNPCLRLTLSSVVTRPWLYLQDKRA